jgi:hypothetical protein
VNLTLRRAVWLDGENTPNDYTLFHDGQKVGRILRMNGSGRELWCWVQFGPRAPTHGPNGGVADTLEDAEAAFRRAWDA